MSKAKLAAEYEVGWWRAHHYKDYDEVLKNMVNLYQLLFDLPESKARKAVKYRVEATKMHDIAEEFEDKGERKKAEKYWNRAKKLLEKHFEILLGE